MRIRWLASRPPEATVMVASPLDTPDTVPESVTVAIDVESLRNPLVTAWVPPVLRVAVAVAPAVVPISTTPRRLIATELTEPPALPVPPGTVGPSLPPHPDTTHAAKHPTLIARR